ncbi:MAG: hypothetical protein LBH59_01455 [Planctomycetaceae bacterium]|nr:hypothetical protein [Planctomycetaceae bacterium]
MHLINKNKIGIILGLVFYGVIPKPVWAVGFALEQTLRDATLAVFSFANFKTASAYQIRHRFSNALIKKQYHNKIFTTNNRSTFSKCSIIYNRSHYFIVTVHGFFEKLERVRNLSGIIKTIFNFVKY